MGMFIDIDSGLVRASQDFLVSDTLAFIAECYERGKLEKFPPAPIVRRSPVDGSFIAIDGHHLLAANAQLCKTTKVYVAESETDFLPGTGAAIARRNVDLQEKFHTSAEEANRLASEGIATITDLIRRTS